MGGVGGYADGFGARAGGAGVFSAGTITTLTNTGIIAGAGGAPATAARAAGVSPAARP